MPREEHGDFGRMVSESMRDAKPYHGMMKPKALPGAVTKDGVREMVNLPNHYARYSIEPIRFLVENGLDPLRFNAIKYIMRADDKQPTPEGKWEDLKKAIRCIEMWGRKFIDNDPDWWRAGRPGDKSIELRAEGK